MERPAYHFEAELEPEFESYFIQEEVKEAAAQTAHSMLVECVDSSLKGEPRFDAIVALIEELTIDVGNRYIVVALREQLTFEKTLFELQYDDEQFSLTI